MRGLVKCPVGRLCHVILTAEGGRAVRGVVGAHQGVELVVVDPRVPLVVGAELVLTSEQNAARMLVLGGDVVPERKMKVKSEKEVNSRC